MSRSGLGYTPKSQEEIEEERRQQKKREQEEKRRAREEHSDEAPLPALALTLTPSRPLSPFNYRWKSWKYWKNSIFVENPFLIYWFSWWTSKLAIVWVLNLRVPGTTEVIIANIWSRRLRRRWPCRGRELRNWSRVAETDTAQTRRVKAREGKVQEV